MDLKQLEYFVRVAELGSFTRAAVALDVAQPALSRQVRLLEVELRQNLLTRNGRGAAPTEAGKLLLEQQDARTVETECFKFAACGRRTPRRQRLFGRRQRRTGGRRYAHPPAAFVCGDDGLAQRAARFARQQRRPVDEIDVADDPTASRADALCDGHRRLLRANDWRRHPDGRRYGRHRRRNIGRQTCGGRRGRRNDTWCFGLDGRSRRRDRGRNRNLSGTPLPSQIRRLGRPCGRVKNGIDRAKTRIEGACRITLADKSLLLGFPLGCGNRSGRRRKRPQIGIGPVAGIGSIAPGIRLPGFRTCRQSQKSKPDQRDTHL